MIILEIKKQKKGKLLVRTDEVGTFPVYEKEAAAFHLEEGAEIPDGEWERLCSEVLSKRAKKRALHLLEQMDRTEFQLRQKLKGDHYPDFLVDEAVEYVKSYHYIDDLRYAESYLRYQQEKKSRLQIKNTLLKRGVPADLIDQAFEEEYEADEGELIARILEKRGYDPEKSDPDETRRTYQYLLRRGFSVSEIRRGMDLT
ncbi:MAG: recombination regulator RecX [Lachnospiraceae bacterium]|nr:recombination regulator RecX [Lachnospiraceae bacterium]